ncbi:MAG: hypothetical protein K6C40_14240 [Thermoguttaceae bacterium]|nr:hypothetical protein [Thermoguttaceae bacterium]
MIFPFFHSVFSLRRSRALAGLCLGIAAAVWTFTGIFSLNFLLAQEKPSVFKGKTFGHHIAAAPKDAAPEDSEADPAPLRFRRVYVPQELLPEIPTFGKNYWPIPEKEFNVWLAENSVSETGAALLPKTLYAEKAVYRARLSENPENKCFIGTADFRIRRIPEEVEIPKTAGNPDVLFWTFPPVSFALSDQLNVRRAGEKEAFTRHDFNFLPNGGGEAVLNSGDFSSSDSQESACDAKIEWSQRFVTSENGDLRLNLEWIPATDAQWIFELPPELVPETPDGLVILERAAENAPEASSETVNHEETGASGETGVDGKSAFGGESKTGSASDGAEASGAAAESGVAAEAGSGAEAGTGGEAESGGESASGDEKDWLGEHFEAAPGLNVWRISFGGRRKASVTFRSRTKPALHEMPVSCTQKIFTSSEKRAWTFSRA